MEKVYGRRRYVRAKRKLGEYTRFGG